MSDNTPLRFHAYVTGQVQGVGFRYFTLQAAQELHLTGWVRNLYDGRVEVMAEGDPLALNQFLARLRRGPIGAGVDDVKYDFSEAKGDFTRFTVLMTG